MLFSLRYFKMDSVAEPPAPLFSDSNDDMEEGDPGSDSDFEVDAKKEVGDAFCSGLAFGP